ncbi:MAG: HAD-IIA family hydrolase, partial [Anaerolineaceae bacterium]|nr:HAD-IIA family hydrolase [Anaerolineaceae bacterium]
LHERSIPFMFLTNNSSKNKSEYQRKLISLGVKPDQALVFTSGDATASYLSKDSLVSKVYVVGTQGLIDTFISQGLTITDEDPDVVVLGFDTSLTYAKICKLCEFIVRDKPFIATHFDINCPTPSGFIPDVGSMLAMIKASTGREPDLVIGKPNRVIVDMIASELNLKIEDCAMVGDRLYTDIAMGATSGIKTVLVLTGETSREDLIDSIYKPDFIVQDLNELREQIR